MRTSGLVVIAFLFFFLNIGIGHASSPDPVKKASPYTQMLIQEIKSLVTYPSFAREKGLEGFVLISFDYDELGRLRVIEANSNSVELKDYVVKRLLELDLCSHARKPGKVYNMRFDFRLI